MRAWQFSRPKGPGYGISKGYYLSVLTPDIELPRPLEILNPKGESGAVSGFLAPLDEGATKDALSAPLSRGPYVVASKDRKTVLRMMVMEARESGVDPQTIASSAGLRFVPKWLLQFTFESHDAAVVPAVEFLLDVVTRVGLLTQGAIADPLSRRYLQPSEVFVQPRIPGLVQPAEHLSILLRPNGWAVSLGMQKFGLPEFEIRNVDENGLEDAGRMILAAAVLVFGGGKFSDGLRLEIHDTPITIRQGGGDPSWHGLPVWEIEPRRS